MGRTLRVLLSVCGGALVLLVLVAVLGIDFPHSPESAQLAQPSLESRLQASQILTEDLPVGWQWGGIQVKDVPGAEARFLWYYGPLGESRRYVNVSEQFILYPDTQAAADAYQEWVDTYIPPAHASDWTLPEELEFNSQADQMTVACLESYVNDMHVYSCGSIGQYKDMIVVVQGNVFDEQWLTMADFRAVLETADRRAAAAVQTEQD